MDDEPESAVEDLLIAAAPCLQIPRRLIAQASDELDDLRTRVAELEAKCERLTQNVKAAWHAERDDMIRSWHERMVNLTDASDALTGLTGAQPESPLMDAIWRMAGEYTTAVDRIAGDDGSLAWFWLECDLGARPKICSTQADVDHRIATIDDLIAFIEACP